MPVTERQIVSESEIDVRPNGDPAADPGDQPAYRPNGDAAAMRPRGGGPCGEAAPCSVLDIVRGDVRPGPTALLTLLGLAAFAIVPLSRFIPDLLENAIRGLTGLAFLAGSILLRRGPDRARRFAPVADALFAAVLAQFLAWRLAGGLTALLDPGSPGLPGMAAAKLAQGIVIVATVVLVVLLSGAGLGSIYLRAGRLRYGAVIGLIGFAAFALVLVLRTIDGPGGPGPLLAAAPWLLAFVLANGFSEELLFRGLFLSRFEPFAGRLGANLATAIVFAAAHARLDRPWSGRMLGFLGAVFLLSLLLGYLMQKSRSLLAPWLLHGGADLLIFAGGFHAYWIFLG